MPTATQTASGAQLGPTSELPSVQAALTKRGVLARKLAELDARVTPTDADDAFARAVKHAERLNSAAERIRLRAELDAADAEVGAATSAAHDDMRRVYRSRKRAAFERIEKVARELATEMRALQDIENAEHAAVGFVDRIALPAFCVNDAGVSAVEEFIARAHAVLRD